MNEVIKQVELLAGQEVPFREKKIYLENLDLFPKGGIGYSQFNEIMLTLGYDRISPDFFNYMFGETISSYQQLEEGVKKFLKFAMLKYGNIKFAFKELSIQKKKIIEEAFQEFKYDENKQKKFENRLNPLLEIEEIKPEEAYYLGYIIENELNREKKRLEADKADTSYIDEKIDQMNKIREKGIRNHEKYLIFDHIDVYIATSMRYRHEFVGVSKFIKELFKDKELRDLKLRWYDPTQVYCKNRIDKGLVEGLMLKRAECTIYHAQESDTFEKDSELATTLVQGKPVICYVPDLVSKDDFIKWLKDALKSDTVKSLLNIMRHYYPNGVWEDDKIRNWISGKHVPTTEEIYEIIYEKAREMYDKRAETLKKHHPLGLQVNLTTGVANGVIVVRKVKECVEILRDILLQNLEFEIDEQKDIFVLKEKKTKSVYRVVTKDVLLTNSFWNFYLPKFWDNKSKGVST